jgi:glucose dehydrogenase
MRSTSTLRQCARLSLAVAFAAGYAAEGGAQDGGSIQPAPAFTERQLTALPRDGWITNGGNLANQRYSPLDQIDRSNVGQLKAVWRASLDGSGMQPRSANQAQPIVYADTLYIVTGDNDVFAIDIDDGRVLWKYEAHVDPAVARPCCGWAARGLAIGEGKAFFGTLDARMIALDQRRLVDSGRGPEGGLQHHERAAVLRRHGHHRLRRRRSRHAGTCQRL